MRTFPEGLTPIIAGFFVSAGISAALVVATAKAGISPGVSPLVVLVGWVAIRNAGPRLHGMLAMLQVTGSGGAAVSAGVIFTAPIIQVYARELNVEVPAVDIGNLILASLSGAFLGWGFVGLATQRFLSDPRLPAPEAVACDRLINTAVENPDQRPNIWLSLIPGLGLGTLFKGLTYFKYLEEQVAQIRVPIPGWVTKCALPIPMSPLYLGIGALLTLPTALLIFGGAAINAFTTGYSAENDLPDDTYRWVGGAAMTIAVAWSLIQYVVDGQRQRRALAAAASLAEAQGSRQQQDEQLLIPASMKARLWGSIVFGAILFFLTMLQAADTHLGDVESVSRPVVIVVIGAVALLLISFLSGLGALLSLQVGASASPVSGTVFMAMLVLSVTALAISLDGTAAVNFLTPCLVAACVAICAANDASQDYKTLQLNGYAVHRGFNGQLVGLIAGAIVVPLGLAYGTGDVPLGGAEYPCPQATFFGTALASLFGDSGIPWDPVYVGLGLGVGTVILEQVGRRFGLLLSPLALAVGIYLPATLGVGILLGALARYLAAPRSRHGTHEGILSAAGFISGYALLSLCVGALISAGMGETLDGFKAKENWGWLLSGLALISMLGVLFFNYREKSGESELSTNNSHSTEEEMTEPPQE